MFLIVLSFYPQNGILKIVIQMFEEGVIQLFFYLFFFLCKALTCIQQTKKIGIQQRRQGQRTFKLPSTICLNQLKQNRRVIPYPYLGSFINSSYMS